MSARKYHKPLPVPQPESEFYWEKNRQHELWLRNCRDCRQTYFYPREICPDCFSRNTTWIKSSGKGILHTFAIVHRAAYPAFQDDVPYIIAIVELEGGVRIPTNLVDVEPDPKMIKVGMAVEVTYDDISKEISLPKFKPAS